MHHRTLLTSFWALVATPALLAAGPVDLDGAFGDWPDGARAVADERFIYLRFDTPEVVTLQQAPWTVSVLIDTDASAATGTRFDWDDAGLGADLRLDMSPLYQGAVGNGVGGAWLEGRGDRPLSRAASAFAWAPTHAEDAFELRIGRAELDLGGGPIVLRIAALDAAGEPVWTLDPVRLDLPPIDPAPERIEVALPAKPDGAVRVLSWNVLWGSPMGNPEPFDRVLQALKPDVVLVQEWDDRNRDAPPVTEEELVKWFNYSEESPVWTAIKGGERGVAIVSRHPMQRIETRTLRPVAEGDPQVDDSRGIRVAAARITTPAGDLVATSLHLKCCGGYAGEEDSQRLAEARAIRAALQQAIRASAPDMVIIGGDFNLVGDPAPQALLASGTDADGGDLVVADTKNLGQQVRHTWREQGSRFAPGRLDYALVGDAGARIANAFIFDASVLSDATLEAIGVQRDDTATSDHLPVVIDILPDAN
jgi:endonuclease/exonuclease/phosphatase family metal-dependent hydrolase